MYLHKYKKYKEKYDRLKTSITKKKYTKLNSKILNKYDKNKDNIITVNEYLAEEASKGPRADPGKIKYDYQKIENVYNFFTLLTLNKIKNYRVMCIPQFEIIFGENYIVRTTTLLDIKYKKYYFPKTMIKAIKKCQYEGIRLVYFTLSIKYTKSWFTHANMVIIDLQKKTLERFEPHGCSRMYDNNKVDDFMKNFVLDYLQLNKYTYIKPTDISSTIGIQIKGDSFGGMCVTISAMYLHMRVLNIDIKQKKIIDYFLKMSNPKLKNTILKFAKYIENTLKKNADIVNDYNYKLYHVIYNNLKNKLNDY